MTNRNYEVMKANSILKHGNERNWSFNGYGIGEGTESKYTYFEVIQWLEAEGDMFEHRDPFFEVIFNVGGKDWFGILISHYFVYSGKHIPCKRRPTFKSLAASLQKYVDAYTNSTSWRTYKGCHKHDALDVFENECRNSLDNLE